MPVNVILLGLEPWKIKNQTNFLQRIFWEACRQVNGSKSQKAVVTGADCPDRRAPRAGAVPGNRSCKPRHSYTEQCNKRVIGQGAAAPVGCAAKASPLSTSQGMQNTLVHTASPVSIYYGSRRAISVWTVPNRLSRFGMRACGILPRQQSYLRPAYCFRLPRRFSRGAHVLNV